MERKVILLVDDDRDTVDAYEALLAVFGHATLKAYDGHQAVTLALDHRPHLIVLDVGLPLLGGFEVLQLLRADSTTARTPVILLTGYAVPDDFAANLQHTVVLGKPCEPEALCEAVQSMMAPQEPAAAPPSAKPGDGRARPPERRGRV